LLAQDLALLILLVVVAGLLQLMATKQQYREEQADLVAVLIMLLGLQVD
jgi:hypothetical protein